MMHTTRKHSPLTLRSGWPSLVVAACLAVSACTPNPADDVSKAQVTDVKEEKAAASSTGARGEEFIVGPGSTVNFTGSKVTGVHHGGFKQVSGAFRLDSTEQIVGSNNRVTIDMGSLWADNDKLAGHLESADFFNVDAFPTTEFEIAGAQKTGDNAYTVTGTLTLHGVTKSISFPATIERQSADSARLRAEFAVQRFDFDIRYPGRPDDLIRNDVVVKLDLALRRNS